MTRERRLVLGCGSRDWTDAFAIRQRLATETTALVIHGGARGADRMVAEACAALSIHAAEMPALWDSFGKRAGFLRNLAMLDLAPDLVIAFTTGSRGTQHTIDEAHKRGIPVDEIEPRRKGAT